MSPFCVYDSVEETWHLDNGLLLQDDSRTPDQRRIDAADAVAHKTLSMYAGQTLVKQRQDEKRRWVEEAERRIASPYHRPVRMATAPKVCSVCAFVPFRFGCPTATGLVAVCVLSQDYVKARALFVWGACMLA